jgi:hypothetical protein
VHVRFGRPLALHQSANGDDRITLRALTDELMFEIVQLAGRYEYRDTYATKKAEDLPVDVAAVPRLASEPAVRVA